MCLHSQLSLLVAVCIIVGSFRLITIDNNTTQEAKGQIFWFNDSYSPLLWYYMNQIFDTLIVCILSHFHSDIQYSELSRKSRISLPPEC